MADQRLDRHGDPAARKLIDSDTAQVGSLGDIVEEHDGDGLSLVEEQSIGGADAGESDYIGEMYPDEPPVAWDEVQGEYVPPDEDDAEAIGETDLTGSAPGIARGFGTHIAQDLGADGFQIEEIPAAVVPLLQRDQSDEELDDYDDDDPSNGKFDSKELEHLSEPGVSPNRPPAE